MAPRAVRAGPAQEAPNPVFDHFRAVFHARRPARPPKPSARPQNASAGPDIDAFEAVMAREDRERGFFVSFDYTADALREIDAFFRKSHKTIIALTVREILVEQLAKKLA